jgi:hypothetical protein
MPTIMTSTERVIASFHRQPVDRIPLGDFCIDNRCAEHLLGRPTPIHNPAMWLDRLALDDWEGLVSQEYADSIELAIRAGLDWISLDANWERPATPPKRPAPSRGNGTADAAPTTPAPV